MARGRHRRRGRVDRGPRRVRGKRCHRRLRPLRRARVHRRAHAPRVDEASAGRVRTARAAAGDDRRRPRPPRAGERARHRRRPLAARRVRRVAPRLLLHGLVLHPRVDLRVAAAATAERRPREPPAPPAGDRARRDDELPRRHQRGRERAREAAPGDPRPRRRPRAGRPGQGAERLCRERLRDGMWLLIREASMARNLQALLPLVQEFGTNRIAFCTDDRDPEDIAENGHINGMVRVAVAKGVAPEDAIVLATLNPATWHRLWHLGAIAPGYQADILVLPDLEGFQPDVVLKAGRPVEEIPRPEVPEWVKHSVRNRPVAESDFRIPWEGGAARVIGLVPDQVVTENLVEEPATADGAAVADPGRDLAKIAVIERHLGTGRIGLGFVRGSGLERGALASTVAHDAHNIVVVGMSDGDMAYAVTRLGELSGGIVVVDGGEVTAELPLPVAGLLADAPLTEVIAKSLACNDAARALGWSGATPFLTLSFLGLSVIPSLKITDRGLVDVDRFEIVPLRV